MIIWRVWKEVEVISVYVSVLQVKFDDIFGEPDPEVFSMDSVWSMANKVSCVCVGGACAADDLFFFVSSSYFTLLPKLALASSLRKRARYRLETNTIHNVRYRLNSLSITFFHNL